MYIEANMGEVKEDFTKMEAEESSLSTGEMERVMSGQPNLRQELDKDMATSIKFMRAHRFPMPGINERNETELEKSARLVNDDQSGGEGLHVNSICNIDDFARLTKPLEDAIPAAGTGLVKPGIREQVKAKLEKPFG